MKEERKVYVISCYMMWEMSSRKTGKDSGGDA